MRPERDAIAYLWDARDAAMRAQSFIKDFTFEQYEADVLRQSALERQVQIVGEALGHVRRVAPTIAARIPDIQLIVATRNILVHGYAVVDNKAVWEIARDDLPLLSAALDALLAELVG